MRRTLAGLSLATGLALAGAASWAQPCACPTTRPPLTAMAESDAVFEGQVTGSRDGDYGSSTERNLAGRWVTLLVVREWKGATAGTTRHVFTPTACAVPFESGTLWVVYARHLGDNHELRTTRCHRTRLAAQAREDLVALGIPGTQIPEPALASGPTRPSASRGARPGVRRIVRPAPRRGVRRRPVRRVRRRR